MRRIQEAIEREENGMASETAMSKQKESLAHYYADGTIGYVCLCMRVFVCEIYR